MSEELLDYYGQPDEGGFIRLHSYDLQQLIKNSNASFAMLSDISNLVKELRKLDAEIVELRQNPCPTCSYYEGDMQ